MTAAAAEVRVRAATHAKESAEADAAAAREAAEDAKQSAAAEVAVARQTADAAIAAARATAVADVAAAREVEKAAARAAAAVAKAAMAAAAKQAIAAVQAASVAAIAELEQQFEAVLTFQVRKIDCIACTPLHVISCPTQHHTFSPSVLLPSQLRCNGAQPDLTAYSLQCLVVSAYIASCMMSLLPANHKPEDSAQHEEHCAASMCNKQILCLI